jgi:hypothetical protein
MRMTHITQGVVLVCLGLLEALTSMAIRNTSAYCTNSSCHIRAGQPHLESLALWPCEVLEEVVEHCCNAPHHLWQQEGVNHLQTYNHTTASMSNHAAASEMHAVQYPCSTANRCLQYCASLDDRVSLERTGGHCPGSFGLQTPCPSLRLAHQKATLFWVI